MAAVYPGAVHNAFIPVQDNVSTVVAGDVNPIYEEVVAIESTLGAVPYTSTNTSGGPGTFYQDGRTFSTVSARLGNVEQGAAIGVMRRVATTGGSTIASTGSTVGLTLSTAGTGDLLVAGNTTINKDGYITLIDGGDANGA